MTRLFHRLPWLAAILFPAALVALAWAFSQ